MTSNFQDEYGDVFVISHTKKNNLKRKLSLEKGTRN